MDYAKCKQKFLAIADLTDERELNKELPGRLRYYPQTRKPRPFEGVSVIHNIDSETADDLGDLSQLSHC